MARLLDEVVPWVSRVARLEGKVLPWLGRMACLEGGLARTPLGRFHASSWDSVYPDCP